MAEERQIIIDVDVNDNNLDQAIGELNTQIKENREEVKELNKDYKENATEIAALERQNKDLAASKRELTKESKIEKGSLNDLRKQLSDATKARNNTNLSTAEGAKKAKELNKEILGLSNAIKEQEEAGGDFRRSVGEYPTLFSQAAGGIKIFGTSIGDVFKLIVANPIGLLISALAGLVAIFKETQAGAEFFRKTGAALNATFGLLKDGVEAAGVAIINAFENPKQTLIDLGNTIKENVVKYFTEFIPNAIDKVIEGFGLLGKAVSQLFEGEFSAALDTATDASVKLLDGLTDLNPATAIIKETVKAAIPALQEFAEEIDNVTESAFGLEEQLIANEKALADQKVTVAQSILSQKKLDLIIKDNTKSYKERLEASREFSRVEQEQVEESIRLQEERIRILKEQNDLTNSTEADIQRVRDAEIELANLQAASFQRRSRNQLQYNSILKQSTAENLKAETDAIKEAEKARTKADKEQDKTDKIVANTKKTLLADGFNFAKNVAGENEKLSKAIALTEIGVDTAIAISGLTANSESNPANAVTFGGAGIAQFAAGAIRIGANIANAVKLIGGGSSSAVSSISSGGGATPSASVSNGSGISSVNASLLGQFSESSTQAAAQAEATGNAVGNNFPPIQVSVTDINEVQAAAQTKVIETTL